MKGAVLASFVFCSVVSAVVWVLAKPLMMLFVSEGETAILAEGVRYLHIEGAFYCGIGCLSLLYGCTVRWAGPHVCGAHRYLAGHARGACLCAERRARLWRNGHLVGGAHRLALADAVGLAYTACGAAPFWRGAAALLCRPAEAALHGQTAKSGLFWRCLPATMW